MLFWRNSDLKTVNLLLLQYSHRNKTFEIENYQSAVGMLLYLSGWTRPDLTFAVSNVANQRTLGDSKVYYSEVFEG